MFNVGDIIYIPDDVAKERSKIMGLEAVVLGSNDTHFTIKYTTSSLKGSVYERNYKLHDYWYKKLTSNKDKLREGLLKEGL